jgi:hypothetical protein
MTVLNRLREVAAAALPARVGPSVRLNVLVTD